MIPEGVSEGQAKLLKPQKNTQGDTRITPFSNQTKAYSYKL